MALELPTRKFYYNRCDPNESLSPGDDRNFDIDTGETSDVRGGNVVERIASRIELSNRPVLELFTGLPGSGKSTELRRLAARLKHPNRAHLLPIIVDAEEMLDLTSAIDSPDILAAIIFSTETELLRQEGKNPTDALQGSYVTRLWNWLAQTDVRLTQGEIAIPGGTNLILEMKTRPTLRTLVRDIIATHLTTFLAKARDEMKLLNDRARQCGFQLKSGHIC